MTRTILRVRRVDDGLLVIDAGALAHAFFEAPRAQDFEAVAGMTRRDAVTAHDIELLNRLMGARTPHHLWEPLGRPRRWLERIDPRLDLIRTSERRWRDIDGNELVRRALVGCVGPGRNIGVATKLLHLKRPRLFPILDRLVVELLGARVPVGAEAPGLASDAAELVLHLRREGRANLQPLGEVQAQLRADGTHVSLVRILDAVLWSSHPAAGAMTNRTRIFRCSLAR